MCLQGGTAAIHRGFERKIEHSYNSSICENSELLLSRRLIRQQDNILERISRMTPC